MANSGYGTEAHLDQVNDHQSECENVQYKESDEEVSINAAEPDAVSGPVVNRDGAVCDQSQSAELSCSNLHDIGTGLIEALSEVKQASEGTREPEEHSTDIKNELQHQPDLEDPVNKLLGEMDEVENGIKTTSSPEPQTSHQDHGYSNPYHHHSLDVNENVVLVQEIKENETDPKTRDDYPKKISGSMLEHLEEMCFSSEIHLQAAEEPETLEPPAKKRLRRRMGMCSLGDRKRKLPFDGQHCRQAFEGRQREVEACKGYKGVQHLYKTVLENEPECCRTRTELEGSTKPACKENEEGLKDKENNVTAVIVEESALGVAERENGYALSNMSKCTASMNEVTTDEPPTEKSQENEASITMDNKTNVSEHELRLLEDISSEVGQTMFNPIIGEILNMIQEELSVAAAPTDHEMEIITCVDELKFLGTEMTNSGQDNELNVKYDVLSEKQSLGNIVMGFKGGQDVSSISICTTVTEATEEVHKIPTDSKESEMKLKEQRLPNIVSTEEPEPNGAELSRSMLKEPDTLFADIMDKEVMDSFEIHYAKHHSEKQKPITAVPKCIEPVEGDTESANGITEPIVPSTGQEYHMQVRAGKRPNVMNQDL